jgi:hypothetical protein
MAFLTNARAPLLLAVVATVACSLGCSGPGSGEGDTAGAGGQSDPGLGVGNEGGKSTGSWSGPDGCTFLTQEDATQLLGMPADPCRVSADGSDRRFDWDGDIDDLLFASVGYFVYANKAGYNRQILCGDDDEGACLDLPGIGDQAFLETRTAVTYVQKGQTFFFSQCVSARAISAEDDAALDAAVAATGRPRDMTTHKTEARWRQDMSCSRAAARLAASKL